MKTVAVFFGGKSNEREISVITGMYCANLLRDCYRVLPVYLHPAGGMLLCDGLRGVEEFRRAQEKNFPKCRRLVFVPGGLAEEKRPQKSKGQFPLDCALNCCHGGAGEGGELSALLDWFHIPSASPAMTASALFLDKVLSKDLLRGMGIPVLPSFSLREEQFSGAEPKAQAAGWREQAHALGYPVIVKPSKLGSSVGISVAHSEEELSAALGQAFRLDGCVLVEKYLKGKRDLNIAAYRRGEEIVLSPIEEVFSRSDILTFREKYESAGERNRDLPAHIGEETAAKIAELLRCVYARLNIRGIVRADFLLSPEGEIFFNELNTVPGTLATYLFGESLKSAQTLLVSLVEEGMHATGGEKEVLLSGILSAPVFGSKTPKIP